MEERPEGERVRRLAVRNSVMAYYTAVQKEKRGRRPEAIFILHTNVANSILLYDPIRCDCGIL